MVTSANADSYTISGDCENTQGDVTITVGTPNILETRTCSGERYTVTLDVSNVTSHSMTVSVAQGTNTATPGVYPTNDQSGPSSAPTATAPSGAVGGSSYGLVIQCNEAGEEVSITANDGLNPSTQTFTCTSAGSKTWNINLTSNVETGSSNICTLSSEDEHGNSAGATTTVNIPVDTLSPRVAVTHEGNITVGSSATFTVTVTDENLDNFNYTPTLNPIQSSATLNPSSCTTNPCSLTVTGAIEGNLRLLVGANSVTDSASNTGPSSVVRSTVITVGASSLSVDSLDVVTGANAADYEISGDCDSTQGSVTITVGTPNASETALCSEGRYTTSLDLSSVTSSPITVSVAQGTNTATPTTSPANDQEGPTTAPVATAPSEAVGGSSYALTLICNEANEEVSITGGTGLDPTTQDFTCLSSGSKIWNLTLADDVETTSTNSFTLSSQDEHGNSAEATTTVNIPIDTLGPRVTVTSGGNIIEGSDATFTVTVTDENLETPNYTPTINQSSATLSPTSCTTNPCTITVSGAVEGDLTLTISANSIIDSTLNTGPSSSISKSLIVNEDPNSPTATSPLCFNLISNEINSYYEHENNDDTQPACPRDVVIPDTVTSIGYASFIDESLTSVIIPNSVTSIKTSAFNANSFDIY